MPKMGNANKRILKKEFINTDKPNWNRLKHLYRVSHEIMCTIDVNKCFLSKDDILLILNNLKNQLTEEK